MVSGPTRWPQLISSVTTSPYVSPALEVVRGCSSFALLSLAYHKALQAFQLLGNGSPVLQSLYSNSCWEVLFSWMDFYWCGILHYSPYLVTQTKLFLVTGYLARWLSRYNEEPNNSWTFPVECLKVCLMSSDCVKYIPGLQDDKQKGRVFLGLLLMVLENQCPVRKSSQQYRLFELLTIMSNSL